MKTTVLSFALMLVTSAAAHAGGPRPTTASVRAVHSEGVHGLQKASSGKTTVTITLVEGTHRLGSERFVSEIQKYAKDHNAYNAGGGTAVVRSNVRSGKVRTVTMEVTGPHYPEGVAGGLRNQLDLVHHDQARAAEDPTLDDQRAKVWDREHARWNGASGAY